MTTTTKTRKPTEITSAAIFRIISKETQQCIGYGVPSDSQPGTTYFVRWDYSRHQYECNCKSVKPCKHIRSVQSVLAAKKQLQAPRRLAAFFQALATVAQQQVATMAVQEAEQVVQPPQRYCEACSCVGKLHMVDGLTLCQTCAENTRPAPIEPPTPVAPLAKPTMTTKPLAVAKTKAPPTIVNRGNAQLGNNKVFSLMR